jgi:lysosomal Pro-X carboxypeptidase
MRGLALVALWSVVVVVCGFEYQTKLYPQPLDHFNFEDGRVFSQRVLYSTQYYQGPGSPVFFYCGNEGTIEVFAQNTGFMWEAAEKASALIVFAEHRYFGETLPFGNLSLTSEHVGWLSVEQALADFARVIPLIKKDFGANLGDPVVAFGGSYGGMLAAWFRIKYPHVVDAALASSAPIFAGEGLWDPYGYNDISTRDYELVSPDCSGRIKRTWTALTKISPEKLAEVFQLCPSNKIPDVNTIIAWMETAFSYLSMTDYPSSANFLQPLPAWPVNATCQPLLSDACDESNESLVRCAFEAANVYYNTSGQAQCTNVEEPDSGSLGDDGWDYLACTQMVMPLSSGGDYDMYHYAPWNLSDHINGCKKRWGQNLVTKVNWITETFGTREQLAHVASNIIFSNGMLDPWRAGGVTETLSDTLIALVIDQSAHHLDLRASSPEDPESVVAARLTEFRILMDWIGVSSLS